MTNVLSSDAVHNGPLGSSQDLHALVEQFGVPAAALFVERFILLWPSRRHRLCRAVEQRDATACREVALSLASSSTMAGARRLAELASQLHGSTPSAKGRGSWPEVDRLLNEIDRIGDDSMAEVLRQASDTRGLGMLGNIRMPQTWRQR